MEQSQTLSALRKHKKPLLKRMRKNWQMYLMMVPLVVFLLVFSYYPMYGIIIAFKNYLPSKGIMGSE